MTTDTIHPADSPLAATFKAFFETKTAADVAGTMSYFSPDMASYIDATLGWDIEGHDGLRAVFEQYMPNWSPPARSYATAVFSNETSALIHMVDTPELFGGELRILAAEADGLVGITALELDDDGLVTRVTSVYDSRQIAPDRKATLVAASSAS